MDQILVKHRTVDAYCIRVKSETESNSLPSFLQHLCFSFGARFRRVQMAFFGHACYECHSLSFLTILRLL